MQPTMTDRCDTPRGAPTGLRRWAHFVALGQVGGVEASCLALAKSVHERDGSEHTLFADRLHPFWEAEWPAQGVERRSFKRACGIRLPSRPRGLQARNLSRHLKALTPDVLLFWNLLYPPEIMARARRRAPAMIYLERGAASLAGAHSSLQASMPFADLIIANSHASRRTLQLRWQLEQPIKVIPNPLRPLLSEPAAGPPKPHGRTEPPFRIGMVGRLKPFKGFALGIHALRRLLDRGIDARLAICGEGPELAQTRALADSLGIAAHVEMLGTRSDMAHFYDHLDILLCPSLREPFGLVSIEAQARGTPVVATATDGLPETIDPERTGITVATTLNYDELPGWGVDTEGLPDRVYSPASDRLEAPRGSHPDAIAEALAALLTSPERRQAMSAEAIRHVQRHFSMDHYVDDMTRIVQDTLQPANEFT